MSSNFRFYDSDEEPHYEIDYVDDNFMKLTVQERTNPYIEQLSTFLKDPTFIMSKGNPLTQLINLQTGISYNIPGNKINKFFDILEQVRRTNPVGLKWEERQYFTESEYSGIMIDLDIYQEDAINQFTQRNYNLLTQHLANTLKHYLQIEEYHQEGTSRIHAVFLRRPKITRKDETSPYKDGMHILLPGVKIRKETKKFLLNKFANPDADIFRVLKVVKPENNLEEKYGAHNIVDKNSATAPVFLYGCERRDDHQPYQLEKFLAIDYPIIDGEIRDAIINDITPNYSYFDDDRESINKPTSLWIQEFSLNWEVGIGSKTLPVIKKYNYKVRPEYSREEQKYIVRPEFENEYDVSIYGDLDIRKINDPDTDFYKALLDTLNPSRAEKWEQWFDVLCVLAHIKGDRKILAQYFSQKCPEKYNPIEFEKFWNQAKNNRKNVLNIGSLCFWAKQDNPERYKEVCNRNVHSELLRRIFGGASEGLLGHYDVASILFSCMRYKYIWAPDLGGIWFECVTEEDDHKEGEVFKWRPMHGQPSSMRNYISVIMPEIFMQSLKTITVAYNKAIEERETKFYFNIMKNFKISCRKLKDSSFKTSVIREAQDLYSDYNFTDKLDKCPTILPLGNGILVLDKKVKLIRGYHNYIVSKYAPTKYVSFNPRDPIQKKVLYMYRNLFPDDEPDTHEFFMSLYASSLDGKQKDQIFCIKMGVGKQGKTMTTEIHRNMLGHIFAVALPIQFIMGNQRRDAEASSPATMKAEYARHIDYQESERCDTLSSSKMKLITGGGTIGGRENYGQYRNFQLNCNHVMDTNHEPKINDTTFSVWRRIKLIEMKMRFHSPSEMANFDEKNPYHRIGEDVDLLIKDSEFLSAYLAVLTWYYQQLQIKYKGSVLNVPHPNIQNRTQMYRDSQNKLSMFYTKFLIRCNKEESNSRLLLDEIRSRYERWYKTIGVVDNTFRENLASDIDNSIISGLIQKDPFGPCDYIIGYRLREYNGDDELKEGEQLFIDPSQKNNVKISMDTETWEQYYERICNEYDNFEKELFKEKNILYSEPTKIVKPVNIPTLNNTDVSKLPTLEEVLGKDELKQIINYDYKQNIISKSDEETQSEEDISDSDVDSENDESDDE
jgi:hypothetical protein